MVERKRNEQGPLNAEQRKKLRGFVEEYERRQDEIELLGRDQKDLLSQLKEEGLDVQAFKETIRLRKKSGEELEQLELFEQTVATYRAVVAGPDKPPRSMMIDRPFAPPLDA